MICLVSLLFRLLFSLCVLSLSFLSLSLVSLVFFLSPCDVVLCCVSRCGRGVVGGRVVCVFGVRVCVWCGTLKTPVCGFKMCFNMCAWCQYTRARFECTHGGVFLNPPAWGRRQFCLPRKAHVEFSLERNRWILHIFSSRIDREQHDPDSSNHSLYLIKLFSFRSLEGNFGGNQL